MRTYTICENFGLRDVKITILKLTEEKDDKVGIAAVYADCPVLPEKTPGLSCFTGEDAGPQDPFYR